MTFLQPKAVLVLLSLLFVISTKVDAAVDCASAITVAIPKVTISVGLGKPVSSLADALTCAAAVAKQRSAINSIAVVFDSGIYRQANIVQYPTDLASWRGALTIRSNGLVILSGAKPLTKIAKLSPKKYQASIDSADYISMRAHWIFDHGGDYLIAPPKIIVGGEMFELAREPNSGFIRVAQPLNGTNPAFSYVENLTDLHTGSVYAHGFFSYDWLDSIRVVKSHDNSSKIISLAGAMPSYGIKTGGRFFLEGSSDFVDREGEFAPSAKTNTAEFYSADEPTKVEITKSDGILQAKNINNLTLKGLVFESVRGTALYLAGNNINLDNVTIRKVGWNGIVIKGLNNKITNSKIYNIGFTPVEISGGDRSKLTASNSILTNSSIYQYGQLAFTDAPAIKVDGVGVKITDNTIHDGPHSGIVFTGNDHLIKGNEIFSIAKLTGDVGVIYTGRDLTAQGTVIQENYIHDSLGVGEVKATAIYLDDQASGITISKNVISNVYRGVHVGGGRNNTVTNNVMLNVVQCLKLDDRGLTWQKAALIPGGVIYNNAQKVPYSRSRYMSRYPGIDTIFVDKVGVPLNNNVMHNIGRCAWFVSSSAVSDGGSKIESNIEPEANYFANPRVVTDAGYVPQKNDFAIDWISVFPN